MTTKMKYIIFLPVQLCILPVQRTAGLVCGLAYDSTCTTCDITMSLLHALHVLLCFPSGEING